MKLLLAFISMLAFNASAASLRAFKCMYRRQQVVYRARTELKAQLWGASGSSAGTAVPSQGGFTDAAFTDAAFLVVQFRMDPAGTPVEEAM